MFRKSKIEKQLNLQSSVSLYIERKSLQQFSDKTAWHNVFFDQITARVDESLLSCLYSQTNGAPNAPIRVLIAMMILKDGHGWSDQTLYEQCRFNLLVRKALGIIDLDEPVPSESTYYLLRRHIFEYKQKTQKDLLTEIFKTTTQSQILEFEVSGKSIRMDSKLIGSNIAFYSRYEIIHRALCLFLEHIDSPILHLLSREEQKKLESITQEDSTKTVYRSTKDQIKERLATLGILIYKLITIAKDQTGKDFQTIKRIFEEQYKIQEDRIIELRPIEEITVREIQTQNQTDCNTNTEPQENKAIELRDNKEISAQSIQSPYDTDCTYRKKNETVVKGYSHNLTETCDPDKLNLIIDIQTEPACVADDEFVIPALTNSQSLLKDKIENAHTDGAYNSQDNQEYTKKNHINFYLTGLQGAESRYDLTLIEDGLQVVDKQTGEILETTKTKNGKFRIKTEKNYRYFGQDEIDNANHRKQIEHYPQEIKNKRNNVEASIYQLSYCLRKDKTRYRGLIKNQMWATLRCLWINCVRIVKQVTEICQRTSKNVNSNLFLPHILHLFFSALNLTRLDLNGICKKKIIKISFVYPTLVEVQIFKLLKV
jgi:hypothetical protein